VDDTSLLNDLLPVLNTNGDITHWIVEPRDKALKASYTFRVVGTDTGGKIQFFGPYVMETGCHLQTAILSYTPAAYVAKTL